jgi:hypothetical protein
MKQQFIFFLIFNILALFYILNKTKDKTEQKYFTSILFIIFILFFTLLSGYKNVKVKFIIEICHSLFWIFLISTIFFSDKKYIAFVGVIYSIILFISKKILYNKKKETGCIFNLIKGKPGKFHKFTKKIGGKINFDNINIIVFIINVYKLF